MIDNFHGLALCLGAEKIVLVFVVPVISKKILVFCFVSLFLFFFFFFLLFILFSKVGQAASPINK